MQRATHTTNVKIHKKVAEHIRKYDALLEIDPKRKLRWLGHVVSERETPKGTMTNKIVQGKVGLQMKRSRGRLA